jgi:ABC-2 type transport system permease protein
MSLWRLVTYKIKIFVANFSRGEKRRRYLRIASTIVLTVVLIGFSFGAYAIFKALSSYGGEGPVVASLIVVMGFHALLVVGLVFDIAATTNIFFLSSDLNLLMASPLSALKVFALKYVESLASASVITVMVGVPMLVGYGAAFDAPGRFYCAMVAVIILFMSVPVSIGTLLGLVICRYVSASKVKEILGVAGGLIAFGIWFAIQLLRPRLEQPDSLTDFDGRIRALASYGNHAVLRLLPSHMAAQSLTAIVSGEAARAVTPFLWLTATAGLMMVVSIVLAQRMYLTGWTRVVPGGRKTGGARRKIRLRWIVAWLPPVERSIVATTAHLFVRDPQQVMPIATITVMMAVLPFLMGRSQAGLVLTPRLIVQSLGALTFIGSLHLATSASTIDGRGFWIILAAPCSTARKLVSKLMVPMLFFLPLAFAVALVLRLAGIVGWAFALRLIWVAACTTSVGGSAGLLLGITYADWEWEMPKRMLRTTGRLVMIGAMAFFFAIIAVLAHVSTLARNLALSTQSDWIILAGGSLGAGAVTAILLRLSAKKLKTMEWTL